MTAKAPPVFAPLGSHFIAVSPNPSSSPSNPSLTPSLPLSLPLPLLSSLNSSHSSDAHSAPHPSTSSSPRSLRFLPRHFLLPLLLSYLDYFLPLEVRGRKERGVQVVRAKKLEGEGGGGGWCWGG